jgi:DNA-binding NarL/FixJ family response regulator
MSVHRIKILIMLAPEGDMEMIRVLLVDDQNAIRRGLQLRLALELDLRVVGEAGNAAAAMVLAHTLHPDVIVMDIEMPDMDGVMAIQRLRDVAPAAGIVVLTLRGDRETRARVQEAGAQAFIEKLGGTEALLQAIRDLAPHSREPVTGASTEKGGTGIGGEAYRSTGETRRAVSGPLAM